MILILRLSKFTYKSFQFMFVPHHHRGSWGLNPKSQKHCGIASHFSLVHAFRDPIGTITQPSIVRWQWAKFSCLHNAQVRHLVSCDGKMAPGSQSGIVHFSVRTGQLAGKWPGFLGNHGFNYTFVDWETFRLVLRRLLFASFNSRASPMSSKDWIDGFWCLRNIAGNISNGNLLGKLNLWRSKFTLRL